LDQSLCHKDNKITQKCQSVLSSTILFRRHELETEPSAIRPYLANKHYCRPISHVRLGHMIFVRVLFDSLYICSRKHRYRVVTISLLSFLQAEIRVLLVWRPPHPSSHFSFGRTAFPLILMDSLIPKRPELCSYLVRILSNS